MNNTLVQEYKQNKMKKVRIKNWHIIVLWGLTVILNFYFMFFVAFSEENLSRPISQMFLYFIPCLLLTYLCSEFYTKWKFMGD